MSMISKHVKQLKKNDYIMTIFGEEKQISKILPGLGIFDVVISFTDGHTICLDENEKIIFVEKDF